MHSINGLDKLIKLFLLKENEGERNLMFTYYKKTEVNYVSLLNSNDDRSPGRI